MTAPSRRSISTSSEPALECRRCRLPHPGKERFCRNCGSPLVAAGAAPAVELDELAQRARKVHPRLAHGEPQRVAVVRNLAEGELVQGILLEEGIPSILRRCGGFDVPDMIAAGPRDVLVPASGVAAARALLGAEAAGLKDEHGADDGDRPDRLALRLAAGLMAGLLFFGAVAGAIYVLIR